MLNYTKILLDKTMEPETKVYLLANDLRENNLISAELWYAILDLKEKHFKTIQNDIVYATKIKYIDLCDLAKDTIQRIFKEDD